MSVRQRSVTTEHMGDIMVQIRRHLGGESRISKVIVLKVRVIRKLIAKALKSNVHGPRSQFVFPSRGVARNAGGLFFPFASMKAGTDQLEI